LALRIGRLLGVLHEGRVEYVLTGSVAAMAYGLALVPRDLDIAPSLETGNLDCLATVLRQLGAKPKYAPTWLHGPTREQCEAWIPEPADEVNLDHRFVTAYGELDVVPRKAGSFAELAPRAIRVCAFGIQVRIAHLDDLVLLCERWDRPTDRRRLPALVAARDAFEPSAMPGDVTERLTSP
jgi:hypothetical protein